MRRTLLYSITYSLVAFPLTPKHMTLNDHFTLNSAFFAGMSGALKSGFRSLATLKLVANVGEHQTETNDIARFPCDSTAFLLRMFGQSLTVSV